MRTLKSLAIGSVLLAVPGTNILVGCQSVPSFKPTANDNTGATGSTTTATDGRDSAALVAGLAKGRASNDADAAEAFAGVGSYARVPGAFFGDPSELLGRVVQVTRNTAREACPAQVEKPEGYWTDFALYGFAVRHDAGHDTLKQIVVTKKLAANISFLSFLSAQMSNQDVYDLEVRHRYANASVDAAWVQARQLFKNGYGADLYADNLICWLYVVQAVAEIETIGSKYHETTAGGAAGAWGVNIDGKLYSSDRHLERTRTFWVFVTAIKNPPSRSGAIGEFSVHRRNLLLASAEMRVAQQNGKPDQPKDPPIRLKGDLPPVNNGRILIEMDKAKTAGTASIKREAGTGTATHRFKPGTGDNLKKDRPGK